MSFAADQTIKVLRLPDAPLLFELLSDFFGGEAFPRVQNFRQLILAEWSKKNMHMIGHDHESMKPVALTIKVMQCF